LTTQHCYQDFGKSCHTGIGQVANCPYGQAHFYLLTPCIPRLDSVSRPISYLCTYVYIVWKILLLFILLGLDPTYFPANFHCSISVHTSVDSAHLFRPIRVYFARSASISISPINTTVPPIILQYCFGLKTVWIK
jgi:hypothetical protein